MYVKSIVVFNVHISNSLLINKFMMNDVITFQKQIAEKLFLNLTTAAKIGLKQILRIYSLYII